MLEVTVRQLHEATLDIVLRAQRGERIRILVGGQALAQLVPLDDASSWIDGDVMEARIRGMDAPGDFVSAAPGPDFGPVQAFVSERNIPIIAARMIVWRSRSGSVRTRRRAVSARAWRPWVRLALLA